jgi:4-amino-4-deoxy-L-arabinose transferase-like glycosyltransferase
VARAVSLRAPRLDGRTALILLAGVTLLRLVVAATAPLSPDEAYYWVWSRALAPGYLDHPPMVALWVRAGTALAGQTALGIRLLGPLSAALGSVLLWQAARDLLGDARAGLPAALLLNATLLFGAGAVTMTPDTPLLFFWTVALWAMARLIASDRGAWWLVVGAACGLALCSKYTAALLPLGILLWLVWTRQWHWLARPMLWASVLLGAGVFAPVLWWNARHGWVSFVKQGGRNLVFHPAALVANLGALLAGQAALATPLILLLCAAGLAAASRQAWRTRAPGPTMLAALSLPAIAVFIEHAIGDRVQPNWPAIVYPAAAIAACLAPPGLWRMVYRPAIALGLVLTALVFLQSAVAPVRLSRHLDPTLRLSGGYAALAGAVQAEAARRHVSFIAVDDYGPAALLALLGPHCMVTVGLEPRWAWFDLPSASGAISGQSGLLLRSTRRREPPTVADWSSLAEIGTLARVRDGQTAETYRLYAGIARPGAEAAALLPCPPRG